MKLLLPTFYRSLIEPRLPEGVEALWSTSLQESERLIADVDIASLDSYWRQDYRPVVAQGARLRWLFTLAAGVEGFDHALLRQRGILLTNGVGINAAPVADYAVLGILSAAKRLDQVVRAHDRSEWLANAPGTAELDGSRALIIGQGEIGTKIAQRLRAFDVKVTGVTRSGRDGTLTADQWRSRLGDYDWVVIAAPATAETRALIGAEEFRAMKSTAWLVNIARGSLVDQPALIAALESGEIGGAFLDTVSPEPLPADDPLWKAPNCLITMHLAGHSQTGLPQRAADLFLENLKAFRAGEPMRNVVDLDAGY